MGESLVRSFLGACPGKLITASRRSLGLGVLLLFGSLVLIGGLAGCNTTGRPLPEMVREVNSTLHIGDTILPGDKLEVRFVYESDWNHTTTVSEKGTAVFLGVDEMLVGGLTIPALDELLSRSYSSLLQKPDLTVRVMEAAPRMAAILGEVREPGHYAVRDRYTIFDLMADAEGYLKRTADLDALLLVRWMPELQQARAWTIDCDPEWWTTAEPLYIQPLDMVFIPNKPIDKVNIFVDQYLRLMLPFPYLYIPTVSY